MSQDDDDDKQPQLFTKEEREEQKRKRRSIYDKQVNPVTGKPVNRLDEYFLDHAEKYPRDHISRMDANAFGIRKSITHRSMLIYYLAACGLSNEKIAEHQQEPVEKIAAALRKPSAKECIDQIRWKLFGRNIKKRIEQILPEAVETAYGIMKNESYKESTRLEAAKDFMDRGMGRPTQTIEVEGNLVKQLLEKLDGKSESRPKDEEDDIIDAVFRDVDEIVEAKPESDDVDSWAEANLSNMDKLSEEGADDGKNTDS